MFQGSNPRSNPYNRKNTLIVGYPSGDKRVAFEQIQGLTNLPVRDEWHFGYGESQNEPFTKANYPHHEGTWYVDSASNLSTLSFFVHLPMTYIPNDCIYCLCLTVGAGGLTIRLSWL